MSKIEPPHPAKVIALSKKIMRAAGTQDPILMMNALLMCMQVVDISVNGLREKTNEQD